MRHQTIVASISLAVIITLFFGCSSPVNDTFDGSEPNRPPWPVTGPLDRQYMTIGTSFFLEFDDSEGNPRGEVDPDVGDVVVFEPHLDTMLSGEIDHTVNINQEGLGSGPG